jgi:hypothetical protein
MIRRYENDVFTNHGDATVEEFMGQVDGAEDDLKKVNRLHVYIGFHGDAHGKFDRRFSLEEHKNASSFGSSFHNIDQKFTFTEEVPDDQIVKAVERGRVLFTWCNSDTRVKDVMAQKGKPLTLVKQYDGN